MSQKIQITVWTAFVLLFAFTVCGQEVRLSKAELIRYLSNPKLAGEGQYKYGLRDSEGNQMACNSVIDLVDHSSRYAAVYHSGHKAAQGYRYKIHLATSDDLINWTYQRTLVDNADMPRLRQVTGGDWLVMVHEQWMKESAGGASRSPSQIGFKLFYNSSDLLHGNVRSTWNAPSFSKSGLDGTPNFYECELKKVDEWWVVEAKIGFHYWDGRRDANASAKITKLFSPNGGTSWRPTAPARLNNQLIAQGATGNIGQRENVVVSSGRYNVHEANMGEATRSWDKWRIWFYEYSEKTTVPNGDGTFTMLEPKTHRGSKSFGNPSVSLVKKPNGKGKRIVISYFLFHEGAAAGEAGPLIYYFDLH